VSRDPRKRPQPGDTARPLAPPPSATEPGRWRVWDVDDRNGRLSLIVTDGATRQWCVDIVDWQTMFADHAVQGSILEVTR